MSAAPEPNNAPGVDKGAASLGALVGTLLAFLFTLIPDSEPIKPYLVTIAPGIAIGVGAAWASLKAGMIRRYQEENEEAELLRAIVDIRALLTAPDLTGRRPRLLAELNALEQRQEAIIVRRGGIEPPLPPPSS